MGKYFPKVPKPTFTRGRNLKELLCRARLLPKKKIKTRGEIEMYRNGVTRCSKGKGQGGCITCSYITKTPREVVKEVRIFNAGRDIPVQGRINCKTEGFLYILWSAKRPDMQYLGKKHEKHGNQIYAAQEVDNKWGGGKSGS